MRSTLLGFIALAALSSAAMPAPARAATSCVFDVRGQTWRLRADCQTDESIAVPDGFTLDGRGHRITAVDPASGHFLGAVVQNAGASAQVRNLVIEASALSNVCDPSGPPDQRLAGIRFVNAAGTISGNRVLNINQGQSGCQEGNAIAVDVADEAPARTVRIVGNHVEGYQKTGIVVNGNVDVSIDRNRVIGLGPVAFIGQNGIQLGFGARGEITRNQVSQNIYTQSDAAATGVLLLSAGDMVDVTGNAIEDCDVGVRLVSTDGALVANNQISASTYDAIAIDGQSGSAAGSQIVSNRLSFNAVGVGLYGAGAAYNAVEDNVLSFQTEVGILVASLADDNLLVDNVVDRSTGHGIRLESNLNDVSGNRVLRTRGTGLLVSGANNTIEGNRVLDSTVLDIENSGENAFTRNRCESSSGPPVDCP
jgi:parallel beta-helix repeat protein